MISNQFIALDFEHKDLRLPTQIICPDVAGAEALPRRKLQYLQSLSVLYPAEHDRCFQLECLSQYHSWPGFEEIAAAGTALHHRASATQTAEWHLRWDVGDGRTFCVRTQRMEANLFSASIRIGGAQKALAEDAHDSEEVISLNQFGLDRSCYDIFKSISVHTAIDDTLVLSLRKGLIESDLFSGDFEGMRENRSLHSRIIFVDCVNMVARAFDQSGLVLSWDLDAIVCLNQFIIENPSLTNSLSQFSLLDSSGERTVKGIQFAKDHTDCWWLKAGINVSAVGEFL